MVPNKFGRTLSRILRECGLHLFNYQAVKLIKQRNEEGLRTLLLDVDEELELEAGAVAAMTLFECGIEVAVSAEEDMNSLMSLIFDMPADEEVAAEEALLAQQLAEADESHD